MSAHEHNPKVAALQIVDLISRIEARCLAADGPVTPTLQEMREDELAELYKAAKVIAEDQTRPAPQTIRQVGLAFMGGTDNFRLVLENEPTQDQVMVAAWVIWHYAEIITGKLIVDSINAQSRLVVPTKIHRPQ